MKKFLCLLLAVVMIVGMFSACGSEEEPTPTTAAAVAETNATPTSGDDGSGAVDYVNAPDLSGKTIKLMTTDTWVAGLTLSDVLPRFKQIEELTGCTIIWETVTSDYETVLATRLTGDPSECPDIVLLGNTDMNTISKYVEDGLLYDITKAYDVTPNIQKFWEEDRPDLKGTFTYTDGGIYNLLANVHDTVDGQAKGVALKGDNALWYRADIAQELGFETYPTTINEWYELLTAVHEAYPDMVPMHMWDWTGWESARVFTSAYGLHYNNECSTSFFYADENGIVQYEPALEASKEWLTEMNKWYEDGLIVVGDSEEQKIGAAANGTTFSGFYSGVTGMCEESLKEIDPDGYFLYAPMPTTEGYELTYMGRAAYGNSFGIINNGDEEQCRAALQFLDFAFFSDYGKYSEKLGVMGEGWSFGENGELVVDEAYVEALIKNEIVLQATGANIHFNGPTISSFEIDQEYSEIAKPIQEAMPDYEPVMSEEQEANWEEINAINTAAYCSYFPKFFMSAEDQDVINTLTADLTTFTDEMLEKYILGTADLANFQTEFVDVLYNNLNLQQILDIYQKYYNTYLENAS